MKVWPALRHGRKDHSPVSVCSTGGRLSYGSMPIQQCVSKCTSTTLADLLTPPLGAHPFSTMRASLRRQSSEEFDDCVAHGGQSWLRRRAVDSFFSASLLRDGGAGGRRKRSLS